MPKVISREAVVGDVYDFGVIHEIRPYGFMEYMQGAGKKYAAEQRLIHSSAYLGNINDMVGGLRWPTYDNPVITALLEKFGFKLEAPSTNG